MHQAYASAIPLRRCTFPLSTWLHCSEAGFTGLRVSDLPAGIASPQCSCVLRGRAHLQKGTEEPPSERDCRHVHSSFEKKKTRIW